MPIELNSRHSFALAALTTDTARMRTRGALQHKRVRPTAVAVLIAVGLTVTGCSSTATAGNPPADSPGATGTATAVAENAGLSEAAIVSAFENTAAGATAVHLEGSSDLGAPPFGLDLYLDNDGSGRGQIEQSGYTVSFVTVGGATYLQLTPSFLAQLKLGPEQVAELTDKWLPEKGPASSSLGSVVGPFGAFSVLVQDIFDPSGKGILTGATAAGTTTYQGQRVAVYTDSSGALEYFAADGPAYLLAITDPSGSQAGALTFTWNQPVTVTVPPADQIVNAL